THTSAEHGCELVADDPLRELAELPRPGAVEVEQHDRPVRVRIVRAIRVRDCLAVEIDMIDYEVRAPVLARIASPRPWLDALVRHDRPRRRSPPAPLGFLEHLLEKRPRVRLQEEVGVLRRALLGTPRIDLDARLGVVTAARHPRDSPGLERADRFAL